MIKIKFFTLKLRDSALNFAIILVLIMIVAVSSSLVKTAFAHFSLDKKLPIYAVETDKKLLALTLDCAWENSDTNQLLGIFEKYGIKATFFATGDFCNRYPDDIKLLHQNGHSVQNHSNNHPHVASISREKLLQDTADCDKVITDLTGVKPALYRAPYGEYSDPMLTALESDYNVIQWDVDSRDWQGREASEMANSVLKKVRNGSIILFHNDTKNTPEALEIIIPKLQLDGYEFVLVQDMIYTCDFTLNHEGRQVKRAQNDLASQSQSRF